MPSVAVIVCAHTFDRYDQLVRCIKGVLTGTRPADEFFVVVDNNPKMAAAVTAEFALQPVTTLQNEGRGASDARNTALARATSEVIACIDDDAWPEPTWLEALAAVFADPSVVGAGGKIVPDWETGARILPAELLWVVGSTYRGHPERAGPISRPIGANMAGRRTAMVAVGGFCPEFGPDVGGAGSYNEELVLFTALRERYGADSVRYVPAAVVHHFAPAARTTWRYVISRSEVEGRSKADARRRYGAGVMGHDRAYVTGTLGPAVAEHLRKAVRDRDPSAARSAALTCVAFTVTAASYAWRLLSPSAR